MLGGVWARLVAEGLTRLVCRVFGLVKFEVNAEAAESPRVKRPRAGSAHTETPEPPPPSPSDNRRLKTDDWDGLDDLVVIAGSPHPIPSRTRP